VNFNTVLEWVKSNVLIVVFVVLIFAAPIAMYVVTSGMNERIHSDVEARVQKSSELARLKTPILMPDGSTKEELVNEQLLNHFSAVAEKVSVDAKAVQDEALAHNRKTREVAMNGVFPAMAATEKEVLPPRFHKELLARYQNLLSEIHAGSAPTMESLQEQIELKRRQFITQELRKVPTDQLTPEEQKRLADELSKLRMSKYADTAKTIGIYADLSAIPAPAFDRMSPPTIGELFAWQWEYWVVEDILRALQQANKDHRSVTTAPVKRLVSLSVLDVPAGTDAKNEPESGSTGGIGGFGGADGGAPAEPNAEGGAPVGALADPKAAIAPDYRASLSGRKSNPIYDVIEVHLELIVETERLPEVLDAISKYNFMTVTNLNLTSDDPFEAAASGFYYGSKPVNRVQLQIETVWLRAWTKEFMPESTKQQLGIAPDQPAQPDPSVT
jgi:hypothetical protein